MKKSWKKALGPLILITLFFLVTGIVNQAETQELPGKGIVVQPVDQGIMEEVFQLEIVISGLKRLGYQVRPSISLTQEVGTPHLMVAQGDADFYAVHWNPLHNHYFDKVGGKKTVYRIGALVQGCTQGYLIDKKTADKYDIRSIDSLRDPDIAVLFDSNGDGSADLTGCHEGWGCYRVIEHHLDSYKLRNTVSHHQSNYFEMINETIGRHNEGKPIFYYTWTPLWVGGVLVPGKNVQWLAVPFSSLPEERTDVNTTLPSGLNLGFAVNTMQILANKKFIDSNPAVKRFFELIAIPIEDISKENLMIRQGEDRTRDVRRHAEDWIKTHQYDFNEWITESLKAGR